MGKRGIMFRAEREIRAGITVHKVYWKEGRMGEERLLRNHSQFFPYADSFSWGSDNEETRQLAAVLLYAFFLKVEKMPNGKTTAEKVTKDLVDKFARQHLIPLQSRTWTLRANVIQNFLSRNQL
jgi:hypothetical protein